MVVVAVVRDDANGVMERVKELGGGGGVALVEGVVVWVVVMDWLSGSHVMEREFGGDGGDVVVVMVQRRD